MISLRSRLAGVLRREHLKHPARWLHLADAVLLMPGIAIVELPAATEFTEQGQHWNDYPFVKQLGDDINLGANDTWIYTLNRHEARGVAAALLAAANATEGLR
jgi:hypothetical protein